MGLTIFFLIIVLILYLKLLWNKRSFYYYASKINGPVAWPLIGSVYEFRNKFHHNQVKTLEDCFRKYGHVFKVWIFNELIVFCDNPEDVKSVAVNCIEKAKDYQMARCIMGEGLFVVNGQKWKMNRKKMALLFNSKILNSFFDIFVHYSNILVEKLDASADTDGYFDVYPLVQRFTLDIICETTMGVTVNAMTTNDQYGQWMNKAENIIVNRFMVIHKQIDIIWNLYKKSKLLKNYCKFAHNYVLEALKKREIEKQNSPEKPLSLLDHLKSFCEGIKQQQLIDEAQTMVIAGSETTATSESTILLLLAMHQDVQDKVYEEIENIFKNSNRPIEPDDLTNLKYLDCVIKESLRVLPVAPMFIRRTTKDIQFETMTVPKGASIMVPIVALHRNPEVWPNPLVFDPDRFLPENSKDRHPYAFIPFGAGPRNCIGMRYAMLSIKVMLVTVLRKYRMVSTSYKTIEEIHFRMQIVSKFSRGHPIRIERRNKSK